MAIGKRTWRPVPVDCWDWLEDLSPLAQRLWFWLWTGPTSTPHGIVTVRAYHAAGALGTKPSTLLAALAELEKAGRIVSHRASDSRVDLYLVGYLIAQCRIKGVQRQAIRRAIVAVDLGLPTTQALEDWAIWDSACDDDDDSLPSGKRQPKPQQEQDHKQEQKQNQRQNQDKTAIAVPAPAYAGDPRPVFAPQTPTVPPMPPMPAAAPTGWGFDPTFRTETPVPIPIKLTPEPLPPEPMPEEPPDDFPEVDWSSIPRTIPDLLPPEDLDVAPVPKLTEAAKARLQASQAELRLTPPKPERKPPTPAQLDAMFAKEQLKIAVDLWNEALGKTTCGPADFKALQKLAGTLMGNLSKFSHQYGDSPAIMIGWAAERSEYHGGKGSRSWTFQQWFTADHLAAVYADYRKDRGDQRKIHYVPERNLRAWRLENEERAKCIAEGRIYGAVFDPMPEVA